MKILFLGENENNVRKIEENLYEGETICWYRFDDLEQLRLNIEEFDIIILDGTQMGSDMFFYYVMKLNCHLSNSVLALVENISISDENYIWGMGITDIMKLPFTREECRKKIDNTSRWKWYYDRCNS